MRLREETELLYSYLSLVEFLWVLEAKTRRRPSPTSGLLVLGPDRTSWVSGSGLGFCWTPLVSPNELKNIPSRDTHPRIYVSDNNKYANTLGEYEVVPRHTIHEHELPLTTFMIHYFQQNKLSGPDPRALF